MFNQDQTINYIHDCKHFYQTHKHLISSNAYSISTYSTKNRVLQYYLYININIYQVVISICLFVWMSDHNSWTHGPICLNISLIGELGNFLALFNILCCWFTFKGKKQANLGSQTSTVITRTLRNRKTTLRLNL